MLALNKSVIKVKESQIKGFKMIFELFRKVATSPKSTPDSMTNSTVVTFNTDGKKLTDHLLATLKCCDKTIDHSQFEHIAPQAFLSLALRC